MKLTAIFLFLTFSMTSQAQTQTDTLPYHTIPDYPESYSAAHILARTIDGLGFRYYWATEELRDEDYVYKLGNEIRDIAETMEHMYSLADMINNTVLGQANVRPREEVTFTREERREAILLKLKEASDHLIANPELNLEERPIVFQRGENISEVPIWHLLNGPIADALWHTGQIVSFRRAAGNPLPSGVNVFMGTRKE